MFDKPVRRTRRARTCDAASDGRVPRQQRRHPQHPAQLEQRDRSPYRTGVPAERGASSSSAASASRPPPSRRRPSTPRRSTRSVSTARSVGAISLSRHFALGASYNHIYFVHVNTDGKSIQNIPNKPASSPRGAATTTPHEARAPTGGTLADRVRERQRRLHLLNARGSPMKLALCSVILTALGSALLVAACSSDDPAGAVPASDAGAEAGGGGDLTTPSVTCADSLDAIYASPGTIPTDKGGSSSSARGTPTSPRRPCRASSRRSATPASRSRAARASTVSRMRPQRGNAAATPAVASAVGVHPGHAACREAAHRRRRTRKPRTGTVLRRLEARPDAGGDQRRRVPTGLSPRRARLRRDPHRPRRVRGLRRAGQPPERLRPGRGRRALDARLRSRAEEAVPVARRQGRARRPFAGWAHRAGGARGQRSVRLGRADRRRCSLRAALAQSALVGRRSLSSPRQGLSHRGLGRSRGQRLVPLHSRRAPRRSR